MPTSGRVRGAQVDNNSDADIGELVCGLAEAYAKTLEHKLLLTLLAPPPAADGAADDGEAPPEEPVFR